jgi:hypothetical protein
MYFQLADLITAMTFTDAGPSQPWSSSRESQVTMNPKESY